MARRFLETGRPRKIGDRFSLSLPSFFAFFATERNERERCRWRRRCRPGGLVRCRHQNVCCCLFGCRPRQLHGEMGTNEKGCLFCPPPRRLLPGVARPPLSRARSAVGRTSRRNDRGIRVTLRERELSFRYSIRGVLEVGPSSCRTFCRTLAQNLLLGLNLKSRGPGSAGPFLRSFIRLRALDGAVTGKRTNSVCCLQTHALSRRSGSARPGQKGWGSDSLGRGSRFGFNLCH